MSFQKDVEKWRKSIMADTEKAFATICLSIQSETMRKTPVDTGRLRGNWMLGINNPYGNDSGISIKLGDTVYLTNNLPYARKMEYGGSQQAPTGMLRVTVKEHRPVLIKYGFKVTSNV